MKAKVFIVGRPGSGKSTAARCIAMWAKDFGYLTRHINDYEILKEMFRADTEHKKFRPTEHGGFDAIDLSVLDAALKEVEGKVQECLSSHPMHLVTIEFARDDYHDAFKQFTPAFLENAYFLYTDADIDTCLQRVHKRVACPASIDDHPSFSDDLFRYHYSKDNTPYMKYQLQGNFNVKKKIEIIENIGSLPQFVRAIGQFMCDLLEWEAHIHVSISTLTK